MSTLTAVASKPLSHANAIIISQKLPSHIGNLQPSPTKLKKLGIKVRDFTSEKLYHQPELCISIAKSYLVLPGRLLDIKRLKNIYSKATGNWYMNRTY